MSKKRAHLFSTGVLNDEPDSLQGYYAGFTSRAVAIITDYAIISLVTAVVIAALSLFFSIPSVDRFIQWLNSILPGSQRIFGALTSAPFGLAFFIVFQFLYFIFFFSTTGQTVGKAVMGLRVVTTDGRRMGIKRSFVRTVGYTISLAPLALGFLWVLGEDHRKAWHDKIAHTYVLYVWDARYEENFLRNAVYQLTKKRESKKVGKPAK
ncbi:MAG TPA: RDD family protein [Anaerolineae bacterium]|nr:RDD family protein [Anaerolineae bacterium]